MQPDLNAKCVICGDQIVNQVWEGSWSGKPAGGMWYSGWCLNCNVRYTRATGQVARRGWRLDAPDAAQLVERLGDDELKQITTKLNRYATVGPKWSAFVALKKESDEFWRYREDDRTAIAIVRKGMPVASFRTFGSI